MFPWHIPLTHYTYTHTYHGIVADLTLATYRTVEEACQRSLNHFPCPGLAFPMPALDFDFRIAVRLNPDPARVDAGSTKEITTVAAGVWSGSFGHGRVMVGVFINMYDWLD